MIHKSIFESMLLDLVPFSEVNKPGFLRHHALLAPNFEVASATYYTSLLDPTYIKIRASLENKLISDAPQTVSIGCDGWSAFHHGYLGVNGHYLNDNWDRVIINLACKPFDESHTGENIYNNICAVLNDWKIFDKTGPVLRDNAKNMVAAFKPEYGSELIGLGCVNHTLQLVIHDGLFSLPSVETVIKMCRRLAEYANSSNTFYAAFYRFQKEEMDEDGKLSIKQDVSTR